MHTCIKDDTQGAGCAMQQQRSSVRIAALSDTLASQDQLQGLVVLFNNDSDDEATTITISGQAGRNLLMQLTGAFNCLDLKVVSASIQTSEDGTVDDVFKVTNVEDQKVRQAL